MRRDNGGFSAACVVSCIDARTLAMRYVFGNQLFPFGGGCSLASITI